MDYKCFIVFVSVPSYLNLLYNLIFKLLDILLYLRVKAMRQSKRAQCDAAVLVIIKLLRLLFKLFI